MERLSNELLRDILDLIRADPDKVVGVDRRAYLSVESFKAPSPPLPAQAQDLASFRLVCRRFAALGVPYQFARVTTRFSEKGFVRLDRIASCADIVPHVKKFSYMIPCFYLDGKDRLEELFDVLHGDLATFDVGHFVRKAAQQRMIVTSRRDLASLTKALSAFSSLQHVQILRLQDEPDRVLLDYIREDYETASRYVDLRWTLACAHGARTLGKALLASCSPFSRFSGPMMNPQSVVELQRMAPYQVPVLAHQLTCLELHFDASINVDEQMRALSGMFRDVFTAARGMLAVHLGFPSRAPLGLALEDIFHHVHWERLRAFGIQAWRLDADEIIALVRRHRKTLRGLRLRDVLLNDPSRWRYVLEMLRDEMDHLDWVSLRRIGYARTFDAYFAGAMEVLPDPPPGGGASESDDEEEFPNHLGTDGDADVTSVHDAGDHDEGSLPVAGDSEPGDLGPLTDFDDDNDEFDDDDGHDDDDDDDDEENGPDAHELSMDPDTPSSVPWCNCSRRRSQGSIAMSELTADQLGDNGREVDNWQRKMWERWVLKRTWCPEHQ